MFMRVSDINTDLKSALKDELTAYKYVVLDGKGNPVYITIGAQRAWELSSELGSDSNYIRVAEFLNPPEIKDEAEEAESETAEFNVISNPEHYCFSKYEPKDVIREWNLNFNLGNVVKYVARAGRKGNKLEDLLKAKQYIEFEIDYMTNEFENDTDLPTENPSKTDG